MIWGYHYFRKHPYSPKWLVQKFVISHGRFYIKKSQNPTKNDDKHHPRPQEKNARTKIPSQRQIQTLKNHPPKSKSPVINEVITLVNGYKGETGVQLAKIQAPQIFWLTKKHPHPEFAGYHGRTCRRRRSCIGPGSRNFFGRRKFPV